MVVEADKEVVVFAFGEFELDAKLYRLRRGAEDIRLQPKVFSVLHHLIRHRDRVVSKQELFDVIWPDETLTESVLARTIAVARKALGQKRGARQPIETDYGRGYRFTAPVTVHEARADALPQRVAPGDEAQLDPFVGREAVFTRLSRRLADADVGVGRLCLLVGEAGIGKTRVAEELCAHARAQGAVVLTGRCFEGEGAPALWPWVQVLRDLAAAEDPDALEALIANGGSEWLTLLPELAARLPAEAQTRRSELELEAAEHRFRLLDSIVTFILRACDGRLRVIFLDDLHWADPFSLQLLGFLVREMSQARVLMVGTMRDPELPKDHPVRELVDGIVRPGVAERMRIGGLEEQDIESFIAATTGQPVPAGLSAAVYARTEGNPLFMREALRLLTDGSGHIAHADQAPQGWQVHLPDAARDVIRHRIEQVDEEVRAVLEVAAVMGRNFEFRIVAQVSGVPAQELLDVLGEAEAHGLVEELADRVGQYRFAHILIRDTLYHDLPTRRRVALHRAAGDALVELSPADTHERLREVAHHYLHALPDPTVVDKAVAYAEAAAQAARSMYGYEEAAELYKAGLDAEAQADHPDLRKRFLLYQSFGATSGQAGRVDEAIGAFWEAAKIARALDEPVLLGWATLGLSLVSRIYYRPSAEVDALVAEALERAPERPRTLRAMLLLEKAGALAITDPERRREYWEEARALFDEPHKHIRYRLVRAQLLVFVGPHQIQERLAVLDELLQIVASREDLSWLELDARRHRAMAHIQLADMVQAHREAARCEELAQRYNLTLGRWGVDLLRMGLMFAEGQLDAADRLRERVNARSRSFQSDAGQLIDFMFRLLSASYRGTIASIQPMDFDSDFPWTSEPGQLLKLGTLCQLGRAEDARGAFETAMAAGLERIPRSEDYMGIMSSLTRTAVALRDRDACAKLYEALLPFEGQIVVSSVMSVLGPVSNLLGLTMLVRGQWDAARRHFERALDLSDGLGLLPSAIHARQGLARASDALGGKHLRHAVELRAEAVAEAERIGAPGLIWKSADGPLERGS